MARRIHSKSRKYLGSRSHGGGNAKNRRGKGNKGGVGRAGWHKHKWLRTIKLGEHKQRKYGFHSSILRPLTLTLEKIIAQAGKEYPKQDGAVVVNEPNCRIVGSVKPGFAINATAFVFSKKAKEAIEAAGGKCTAVRTPKAPKEKKPENKSEPKPEQKPAAKK